MDEPKQLAELFDTSKQNIGQHIANILEEKELEENSVVKHFFTTAADGKQYEVAFYALDMILAIGFRVRSKRGTQFRIFADKQEEWEVTIKGYKKPIPKKLKWQTCAAGCVQIFVSRPIISTITQGSVTIFKPDAPQKNRDRLAPKRERWAVPGRQVSRLHQSRYVIFTGLVSSPSPHPFTPNFRNFYPVPVFWYDFL